MLQAGKLRWLLYAERAQAPQFIYFASTIIPLFLSLSAPAWDQPRIYEYKSGSPPVFTFIRQWIMEIAVHFY